MTPSDHPDAKRQLEGEAMSMRERLWYALGSAIAGQFEDDIVAPIVVLTPLVDTVLAALVEPTEAMTEAYWDAVCAYCGHTETEAFPLATDIWKAMIAEASK